MLVSFCTMACSQNSSVRFHVTFLDNPIFGNIRLHNKLNNHIFLSSLRFSGLVHPRTCSSRFQLGKILALSTLRLPRVLSLIALMLGGRTLPNIILFSFTRSLISGLNSVSRVLIGSLWQMVVALESGSRSGMIDD